MTPTMPSFHCTLAHFLLRCPDGAYGDRTQGIMHAEWAVRLDPSNAEYHRILAGGYEQRGALDKAAAEYRRVAELDPRRYKYRYHACRLAQDQQGMLENLQKAIEFDPLDPWLYPELASLHLDQGEYDKAIAAWTKAIDVSQAVRDESADPRRFFFYSMTERYTRP